MRGEDRADATLRVPPMETPPHAWGRLDVARFGGDSSGNTPTCVGKTAVPHRSTEQFVETPPHAWGRPLTLAVMDPKDRNTPTCVGKTVCE